MDGHSERRSKRSKEEPYCEHDIICRSNGTDTFWYNCIRVVWSSLEWMLNLFRFAALGSVGKKVLHSATMAPVAGGNIPIFVRNTALPSHSGLQTLTAPHVF